MKKTDKTLLERLSEPLVIEHAVPSPVHEILQRAADERAEALTELLRLQGAVNFLNQMLAANRNARA